MKPIRTNVETDRRLENIELALINIIAQISTKTTLKEMQRMGKEGFHTSHIMEFLAEEVREYYKNK